MPVKTLITRICVLSILLLSTCVAMSAQGVKRVVIVKIDGLPGYYIDRFVKQKDPETGRSMLPWFEQIFYENGTRVPNFYTRGMSLSGPSWGQLDTGQHLQIKGNVEYDRYTLRAYDYLNFFPYYMNYGLSKKVDMPAVEVMDQLRIPLLSDAFPFTDRYLAQQLYQRGNDWAVIASGFVKLYPGSPDDMVDEWTLGLNFRKLTIDQNERDILGKLVKRDYIDYYDYYDTEFDHVSHHNSDRSSRVIALRGLDRLLGRLWVAIQSSRRADETALVLVSDHGFNSEEGVYSQGFNIVKLLASAPGGGHHVITKRRLMLDYSIKGVYPLVPLITTTSKESYYLDGQGNSYPTALVDFDGNERSSIHVRNNDLNVLHILFQQLQKGKLSKPLKAAAADAVFKIIDRDRAKWKQTADELDEEIGALERWSIEQQKELADLPMKSTKTEKLTREQGERNRRKLALKDIAVQNVADYRAYVASLRNLLGLKREFFDPKALNIRDLIAPGAMGESNTVFNLQNYVVGAAADGLKLDADMGLDMERSFTRVNYFELLHNQRVRNNVQPSLSNRPIDFVGIRIPLDRIADALPADSEGVDDPIWLYGGPEDQVLVLSRTNAAGTQSLRYLPIKGLRQDESGRVTFDTVVPRPGLPLRYMEDPDLNIPAEARAEWLSNWHDESEWLRAVHRTRYSNAVIGINEQLDRHPLFDPDEKNISADDALIRRFRQRQRHLTEADMLILANDHWNFDVRGFNPGGNHGSFFRVSTNSTFMIAGGKSTGIPRGLAVEEPYDSLSFAPTILRLMNKIDDQNIPIEELKAKGFRPFPGRVVKEITKPASAVR